MSGRTRYLTKYGNQTYVSHSQTFTPLHRQTTLSELAPPPADPQQLRGPLLIDKATFYLAFTPSPLPSGTSLFACLDYGENQRLPIKMSRREYFLPEDLVSKWSSLEGALLKVADILREHSQASTKMAAVFNFTYPPSSYGYKSRYSVRDEATSHFKKSLAAFSPLVGYVCGCVFAYGNQTESPPRWLTDLHDNGVPPLWLDELQQTGVFDFEGTLPRLGGVFSTISRDLELFVRLQSTSIHTWYLWTPEEAVKCASLPLRHYVSPTDAELAAAVLVRTPIATSRPSRTRTAPVVDRQTSTGNESGWGTGIGGWGPVEEVEHSAWFTIGMEDSPAPSWGGGIPVPPVKSKYLVYPGSHQKPGEHPLDFFKRRSERNKLLEQHETPESKAARLACEKHHSKHPQPGTKSGAPIVWIWKEEEVGETGEFYWRRTCEHGKSWISQHWRDFDNSQRIFDGFAREWDIWEPMGQCPVSDSDDEMDEIDVTPCLPRDPALELTSLSSLTPTLSTSGSPSRTYPAPPDPLRKRPLTPPFSTAPTPTADRPPERPNRTPSPLTPPFSTAPTPTADRPPERPNRTPSSLTPPFSTAPTPAADRPPGRPNRTPSSRAPRHRPYPPRPVPSRPLLPHPQAPPIARRPSPPSAPPLTASVWQDELHRLFPPSSYVVPVPCPILTENIMDKLGYRFGFLSRHWRGAQVGERDVETCRRWFGLAETTPRAEDLEKLWEWGKTLMSDAEELLKRELPNLARSTIKVLTVPCSDRPLYIISQDRLSNTYQLGTLSATTAMEALRRGFNRPLDLPGLVTTLLQSGVAFQTLRGAVSRSLTQSSQLRFNVPYRPPNWRPHSDDYSSYEDTRERLIRSPRGRAAFMKGGIIWRLAVLTVGHIGAEFVLPGPSIFARDCFNVDGMPLCDDFLSDEEYEVICGTYYIFTGDKTYRDQTEKRSWWPRKDHWHDQPWSEADEMWFQRRLGTILDGKAQPETSAHWKKAAFAKKASPLGKKVEAAAASIFKTP